MRMRDRLMRDRLRLEGMARRLRHPGERLRQQAQRLDDLDMRLRRAFERQLNTRRERLIRLETRLAGQHPGRQLALLRQRLDSLAERLPRAMREGLKSRRLQLHSQMQTLHVVSRWRPSAGATAFCWTSAATRSAAPNRPTPASVSRPGWAKANCKCASRTTT